MFRGLINGIWTTASMVLNHNRNSTNNPPSTSKWRIFRNFIFSAISTLGIPFVRSITESDTLYEYVNTCLAYSTTNRNNIDHRQRRDSGVSRLSRPDFRRRSYRIGGIVRIVKPSINIHIHST